MPYDAEIDRVRVYYLNECSFILNFLNLSVLFKSKLFESLFIKIKLRLQGECQLEQQQVTK